MGEKPSLRETRNGMPQQDMLPGFEFDEQSASTHKVAGVSATLSRPATQKALGAFYTPPSMAAMLVDWALRSPDDRVFDPSFGGFVFLEAALRRLRLLGADPEDGRAHIFGVELNEDAFKAAPLEEGATLLHGDFFQFRPEEELPRVEAVVGNPPYIRYQAFNGSADIAHRISAEAGVPLTRLASSWAPFLIHATSFVAEGGRLAQVLPAELIHAQYANGIIRYLAGNFDRVAIAVFDQRIFPGALEEVVLLFADGRNHNADGSIDLISCSSLAELNTSELFAATSSKISAAPGKLLSQLLPASTRDLLREVSDRPETKQLGEVAAVEIGAVTGANDFFLLSRAEAEGMPSRIARPAVSKAAQIAGASLTAKDHKRLLAEDRKGLIFAVDSEADSKSAAVRRRITKGQRLGVPAAYKCRIRKDWWSVPLPKRGVADLLLTYFASEHPRLVLNEAKVLQTNTIHGVYLTAQLDAASLAVIFYNSLTLLSAELAGRSYGGGVLKLEPSEAGALILPPAPKDLGKLLEEVDALIRARKLEAALDLVDPIVLGEGLDLSASEIQALRDGGARLRARRRSRGARPAPSQG